MKSGAIEPFSRRYARAGVRASSLVVALILSAVLALFCVATFEVLDSRVRGTASLDEVCFARFMQRQVVCETAGRFHGIMEEKIQAGGGTFTAGDLASLRALMPSGTNLVQGRLISCDFVLSGAPFNVALSDPLSVVADPNSPLNGVQARRYSIQCVSRLASDGAFLPGYSSSTVVVTNQLVYYAVPGDQVGVGARPNVQFSSLFPTMVTGAVLGAGDVVFNQSNVEVTGGVLAKGRVTSRSSWTLNGQVLSLSDTNALWRYDSEIRNVQLRSGVNPVAAVYDWQRIDGSVFGPGDAADTPEVIARKLYYRTDYRVEVIVPDGASTPSSIVVRDVNDQVVASPSFAPALSVSNSWFAVPTLCVTVTNLPAAVNHLYLVCRDAAGSTNYAARAVALTAAENLNGFVLGTTRGLGVYSPNLMILSSDFNVVSPVMGVVGAPEFYRGR